MATYSELYTLAGSGGGELRNKITVAIAVEADVIRAEPTATLNHTERVAWANGALNNINSTAKKMHPVVLAQNKDSSVVQIEAATDAVIQSAVASAVDLFI